MIYKLLKKIFSLFVTSKKTNSNKLVYGRDIIDYGIPDYLNSNRLDIQLKDAEIKDVNYSYITPFNCYLYCYCDYNPDVKNALSAFQINGKFPMISRSQESNTCDGLFVSKGTTCNLIYNGRNVWLCVVPLLN